MEFEESYKEFKAFFLRMMDGYTFEKGKHAEEEWLMDQPAAEYDERERFFTFLPLVRYEIENKFLTRWALNEFEAYYKYYINGEFRGLIAHNEKADVEKDLFWCYEHRFDCPIEEGKGDSFYQMYGMKPKLNTRIRFTNGQYHTLKPVLPNIDELLENNCLDKLLDAIEDLSKKKTNHDNPPKELLEGIAHDLWYYNFHKMSK